MNKILVFASLFILWTTSQSQQESYTVANVSFDDFKTLVQEVESVREKKLISFDEFLDLSKKRNTVILDARSREKYNNKHIKGAVNLPFTEFTQENLAEVIPNKRTRVLIYCNNNFLGDQINFASKITKPSKAKASEEKEKEISLALNVPTYITLYGYGYRNIFELHELVVMNDLRLELAGEEVVSLED